MRKLSYRDPDFETEVKVLHRRPHPTEDVQQTVRVILEDVRVGGDNSLVEISNRFAPKPITKNQIALRTPPKKPSARVLKAIKASMRNITLFSKRQVPKSWTSKNHEGARVGENYTPIKRVGIYVPGGTAPLVSSALMSVKIAAVAGVDEIVVCTPPPVGNDLHYAIQASGATEIYGVGGAQAIAALAFGTETIPSVDKIFGPGNAFVVEAKRQVFGAVDIDLLPGPSEIAVIADDSSNPVLVASDLLAQAEHGPGSKIFLLSPRARVLKQVEREIERQMKDLERVDYLRQTLEEGSHVVQTRNLAHAIELVEEIAPEHLSLACQDARQWAKKIRNSGAIFIGDYSPVAAGDYFAGPSHTLPTGGAGRFFGGLMVQQFFKRTSVVEYDRSSLKKARESIETLAELEQLDAHAASIRSRFL